MTKEELKWNRSRHKMMMAFDVIHSILWPYLVKKSLFIFWADLEILAFISQIEGCFGVFFFFYFPIYLLSQGKTTQNYSNAQQEKWHVEILWSSKFRLHSGGHWISCTKSIYVCVCVFSLAVFDKSNIHLKQFVCVSGKQYFVQWSATHLRCQLTTTNYFTDLLDSDAIVIEFTSLQINIPQ